MRANRNIWSFVLRSLFRPSSPVNGSLTIAKVIVHNRFSFGMQISLHLRCSSQHKRLTNFCEMVSGTIFSPNFFSSRSHQWVLAFCQYINYLITNLTVPKEHCTVSLSGYLFIAFPSASALFFFQLLEVSTLNIVRRGITSALALLLV